MTNRSARRTLTILVIVLVAAAAVIVAFLLGRSRGNPQTRPTPPATSVAASHSPTPAYSPTDQYGSPEPALQPGSVRAGYGGTRTGPAGLPLGYSHDETGAVAAASNYLIWMNSLKITDKPVRMG